VTHLEPQLVAEGLSVHLHLLARMDGEDGATRVTNYTFGNAADEHSSQSRAIMLGKDDDHNANVSLSFNNFFHRMTYEE
jgi:hypothetical protein